VLIASQLQRLYGGFVATAWCNDSSPSVGVSKVHEASAENPKGTNGSRDTFPVDLPEDSNNRAVGRLDALAQGEARDRHHADETRRQIEWGCGARSHMGHDAEILSAVWRAVKQMSLCPHGGTAIGRRGLATTTGPGAV